MAMNPLLEKVVKVNLRPSFCPAVRAGKRQCASENGLRGRLVSFAVCVGRGRCAKSRGWHPVCTGRPSAGPANTGWSVAEGGWRRMKIGPKKLSRGTVWLRGDPGWRPISYLSSGSSFLCKMHIRILLRIVHWPRQGTGAPASKGIRGRPCSCGLGMRRWNSVHPGSARQSGTWDTAPAFKRRGAL